MRAVTVAAACVMLSLGVLVEPVAAACPADSVQSGTVCMDKYEGSVWDLSAVPARMKTKLIASIQSGTVTLASLQNAGAVQRGLADGDLEFNGCPLTGSGCLNIYAVSIPGVTPAGFINWFQAAAAARNSLKRLPTNQEWQVAALGTPKPNEDDGSTTCVVASSGAANTGSRSACVSDVGAFDMVGNRREWVADWADVADSCTQWPPTLSLDISCVGGPGSGISNLPAALLRGGAIEGNQAGVLAVTAQVTPEIAAESIGFRCAR